MKILIVEDEINVRKHIKEMLNEINYDMVSEADNGEEAMSLISKEKVDIIISDIEMPIMDGLTLHLNISKTISKDAIFIILSAYNSFSYAQKAINNGIFSYLLKPVKPSDLESVMTLASSRIKQRKEMQINSHQMIYNYNKSLQEQKKLFLTDYVCIEKINRQELKKETSELLTEMQELYFMVVLVTIDSFNSSSTSINYQDENLFKFCINNIFTEVMQESNIIAHSFNYKNCEGYLLNHSIDGEFSTEHPLFAVLIRIIKSIESLLNISISLSVGKNTDSLERIHESFLNADCAMAKKLNGENSPYFINDTSSDNDFSYVIDFNAEKKLLICFEKNDFDSALMFFDELFTQITNINVLDTKKLNNFLYQLIVLLFKITKQFQLEPESILGDEYILYTQVTRLISIHEMKIRFVNLLKISFDSLNKMLEQGGNSAIYKAKNYIDTNYGADLTLESVSNHIYMSPEHFSRLFKKTFNSNFSHYLTELRISVARELLISSSLKIHEIACKVGFNDTRYFCKIFKGMVGMTPSNFRNVHKK